VGGLYYAAKKRGSSSCSHAFRIPALYVSQDSSIFSSRIRSPWRCLLFTFSHQTAQIRFPVAAYAFRPCYLLVVGAGYRWQAWKLGNTENAPQNFLSCHTAWHFRSVPSNYRVIKKSLCTWWLQYRKLQVIFKMSPASLQTFIDTRLTLTPSVIPNSNYVIMVSDWNCLKYFCVFFCNVIIRCTETFGLPCITRCYMSHLWAVNIRLSP
jgi:hypothetical protein